MIVGISVGLMEVVVQLDCLHGDIMGFNLVLC